MDQRTIKLIEKANELRAKGQKISKIFPKIGLDKNVYYNFMAKAKKAQKAKARKQKPSAVVAKIGTEQGGDLPFSKEIIESSFAARVLKSNLELGDKIVVIEAAYGL